MAKKDWNEEQWQQLITHFLGDDFFSQMKQGQQGAPSASPDANIYSTTYEVVVAVELPGIDNVQQIDTQFSDPSTLVIQGKFAAPYQGYEVNHEERRKGSFKKVIRLPAKVKKKSCRARYQRGVLELRFVKA